MFEEFLKRNEEFSAGKLQISGEDLKKAREATVGGQSPKSVVVACSDSRMVPEYALGANIGEIFVIRVAGNRPGDAGMASIEYALDHLGVKEVIVMGHESCGAVGGAMNHSCSEGPLERLLHKIHSTVEGSSSIDEAVKKNAIAAVEDIKRELAHVESVKNGEVKFIAAVYSLSDGKVRPVE